MCDQQRENNDACGAIPKQTAPKKLDCESRRLNDMYDGMVADYNRVAAERETLLAVEDAVRPENDRYAAAALRLTDAIAAATGLRVERRTDGDVDVPTLEENCMWLVDTVSEHARGREEALACLEDAFKRRPAGGTSMRSNETRTCPQSCGLDPKASDKACQKERGRTRDVAPVTEPDAYHGTSVNDPDQNVWEDTTALEKNGKLERPWNDEVAELIKFIDSHLSEDQNALSTKDNCPTGLPHVEVDSEECRDNCICGLTLQLTETRGCCLPISPPAKTGNCCHPSLQVAETGSCPPSMPSVETSICYRPSNQLSKTGDCDQPILLLTKTGSSRPISRSAETSSCHQLNSPSAKTGNCCQPCLQSLETDNCGQVTPRLTDTGNYCQSSLPLAETGCESRPDLPLAETGNCSRPLSPSVGTGGCSSPSSLLVKTGSFMPSLPLEETSGRPKSRSLETGICDQLPLKLLITDSLNRPNSGSTKTSNSPSSSWSVGANSYYQPSLPLAKTSGCDRPSSRSSKTDNCGQIMSRLADTGNIQPSFPLAETNGCGHPSSQSAETDNCGQVTLCSTDTGSCCQSSSPSPETNRCFRPSSPSVETGSGNRLDFRLAETGNQPVETSDYSSPSSLLVEIGSCVSSLPLEETNGCCRPNSRSSETGNCDQPPLKLLDTDSLNRPNSRSTRTSNSQSSSRSVGTSSCYRPCVPLAETNGCGHPSSQSSETGSCGQILSRSVVTGNVQPSFPLAETIGCGRPSSRLSETGNNGQVSCLSADTGSCCPPLSSMSAVTGSCVCQPSSRAVETSSSSRPGSQLEEDQQQISPNQFLNSQCIT